MAYNQPGYPPAQPGYPPQQPMATGQPQPYPGQAPAPAYQQPAPIMGAGVGGGMATPSVYGMTASANMSCPNCKNQISTRTISTVSTTQWIIYIILFLFYPLC